MCDNRRTAASRLQLSPGEYLYLTEMTSHLVLAQDRQWVPQRSIQKLLTNHSEVKGHASLGTLALHDDTVPVSQLQGVKGIHILR